jgi:hypothetical protein
MSISKWHYGLRTDTEFFGCRPDASAACEIVMDAPSQPLRRSAPARAAPVHERPSIRSETTQNIVLEHQFEADQINTGMTHDLITLTTTLLANHVTIRFPMFDRTERLSDQAREFRELDERIEVHRHRSNIRMGLGEAGYHRFLDLTHVRANGEWDIHLFAADLGAIELVPSLTAGTVEKGDPRDFDPRAFIEGRLQCLKNSNRLTGRWPWCLVGDEHNEIGYLD